MGRCCWGIALLVAIAATWLSGCGGAANGTAHGGGLQASALADATTVGYPDGATLVRWPRFSDRVVAYLIYRDTNPYAPVAVESGATTYFIDSGSPLPQLGMLMECATVEVTLDTDLGIPALTRTITYSTDTTDLYTADLQYSQDSVRVTARRVPLQPGEACGYQLRVLFVQYDPSDLSDGTIGHPDAYHLGLGNISAATSRVSLIGPPALESPANDSVPTDNTYRCRRVSGATSYTLQVSPDSDSYSLDVPAQVDGSLAIANYPLQSLDGNAFRDSGMVYWRMGARAPSEPRPTALYDLRQNGWVFSAPRAFRLPLSPPPPG